MNHPQGNQQPAHPFASAQTATPAVATPEPALEFKVARWRPWFDGFVLEAVLLSFCWHIFEMWLHSPVRMSSTPIALMLGLIVFTLWGGVRGAYRIWRESGLALRVDGNGVTVTTRAGTEQLRWDEIAVCEAEDTDVRGRRGSWITLRDHQGQVLAQWNRNWCRSNSKDIKRCDAITERIQQQLLARNGAPEVTSAQQEAEDELLSEPILVPAGWGLFGLICGLFWLGFAAWCYWLPNVGMVPASIFIALALLSFSLILSEGEVRADGPGIESSTPFSRNRIDWQDVRRVQFDERGTTVVFHGDGKILVTHGPLVWRGKDRKHLRPFILAQCRRRNILVSLTGAADASQSKNTRVES